MYSNQQLAEFGVQLHLRNEGNSDSAGNTQGETARKANDKLSSNEDRKANLQEEEKDERPRACRHRKSMSVLIQQIETQSSKELLCSPSYSLEDERGDVMIPV